MPSRPFRLFRQLLADWRQYWKKTASSPRRRSRRLTFDALEERLTPSAGVQEQYMLDLINRFREHPAAELNLILNANDPNVNNALTFYNVDRPTLAAQWATLTPAPPLAWNDDLGSAALAHSQAMLATQDQDHQVAGEPTLQARVVNAGYANYSLIGENIYAYAHSVFEAEAAFAIDWGNVNAPNGIQSPPGHRNNLMAVDLREVGIGLVNAPSGSPMGPLLVTQDFGNRSDIGNPFLLGSVFADANQDGYYEPGEGLAGVSLTITGSAGTFQATTSAAGGYQLQVPAGTYQVTASGGGLTAPVTQAVVVGSDNAQADFIKPILAAPSFTGPPASSTNTAPAFSWTATTGGQYDLWVNNATTGASQVIRNQTLSTNSYTPAAPLPAGTYQAWVRVTQSGATSAWSAAYSFTITPPAVPSFTAPTGSTTNLTPTFTWSASPDAVRYDLWVTNVTTGQSQIIRQTNLATTSFTPGSALPLGAYTAWVQAINNAGNSAGWSAVDNFSLTGPPPPTFTAPTAPTTSDTPTISWTASNGATRYDLWISDTTTGQSQVIRQTNVATTSYTPAAPLLAGTYEAWVQAYNGNVALGAWSAGLSFTITAPAAPVITGPAAVITTTTPTFAWNASTDATQYDVWANNTTTGQNQIIRQTVAAASLTPATSLSRGQYTYWVRAENSAGSFGPWSAGYNFLIDSTAPAVPTISAPASPTTNLTPTISWSASSGATRYDLWVNDASTGQSQIIRQQNLVAPSFTPSTALAIGTYTAWVAAYDGTGQTRGWSAAYSFVITPPAAPTSLSPSGSTSVTPPTFSWSAVTGAATYDLWVDDVTTNQSQVIRKQTLATNSYLPGGAGQGKLSLLGAAPSMPTAMPAFGAARPTLRSCKSRAGSKRFDLIGARQTAYCVRGSFHGGLALPNSKRCVGKPCN